MSALANIFENNQRWAEGQEAKEPGFFAESAKGQAPKYLWIGCADSRVPANQVTGLEPGELFVHRNIANVVGSSDLSLLSVVQYAVEHLKVEHVLACGHYGCGGVAASVDGQDHGLVDNWIKAVGAIAERHEDELKSLPEGEMLDRLCEQCAGPGAESQPDDDFAGRLVERAERADSSHHLSVELGLAEGAGRSAHRVTRALPKRV